MKSLKDKIRGLCLAGRFLGNMGRVESEMALCRAALELEDSEVTRRAVCRAALRNTETDLAVECLDWLDAAAGNDPDKRIWIDSAREELDVLEDRDVKRKQTILAVSDTSRAVRPAMLASSILALRTMYGLSSADAVVGCFVPAAQLDGLEILVTACRNLVQRGINVKLIVVESTSLSSANAQVLQGYSWCHHVFAHSPSEVTDHQAILDMIVFPYEMVAPVEFENLVEHGKPILAPDVQSVIDYALTNSNVSTFAKGDANSLGQRIDQVIKQKSVGAVLARHGDVATQRNVMRIALDTEPFTYGQIAKIADRFRKLKVYVPNVTIRITSAVKDKGISDLWGSCEGAYYTARNAACSKLYDFGIMPQGSGTDSDLEGYTTHSKIPVDQFGAFCDVLEALSCQGRPDAVYFAFTQPDNLKNGYQKRTLNLTNAFNDLGYFVPVMSFRSESYCVREGVAFVPNQDFVLRRLLEWMRPTKVIAASNHENVSRILDFKDALGFEVIYEMRGLWHETFAAKMLELNSAHNVETDNFYLKGKNAELEVVKRCDKVVFISPEMKDYISKELPDRQLVHHVAGNGAILPTSRASLSFRQEKMPFVIGYYGTITYYEGIRLLLDAVRDLRAEGLKDIEVLLIGTNSIKQKQVLDIDAYDFVSYEGFKDNIRAEYARANLFVIPRLPYTVCHTVEPLKPVEYFAGGLPLLMSDCGALNRLAQDGENCLLFAAGDKEALKAQIRDVYTNGYPMEKLEAAYNYVRDVRAWPTIARSYADFLQLGEREKVYFLYGDRWWISAKWSGATVNLINEMIMMSADRDIYYNDVYVNDMISPDGIFDEDAFRDRCSKALGRKTKIMSRLLKNIMLPSRDYAAVFYRAGNGDNVVNFFRQELPDPKIYSHNFVREIWKNNCVGFQNETSRLLAQNCILQELDDDGTLGYSTIDVTPTKSFVRYQGSVTQRQSIQELDAMQAEKTLKTSLNSRFLIGVIGTIYEGTYPDSLIAVVKKLRVEYPEKNISIVFYTINVLKDLPEEDWIHVMNFDKKDQARALLQLDVIVNTWKAYPQIFSGSNKNLDAVNFAIPLITAKTPSYIEQLGPDYPLFHDFENVEARFSAETEYKMGQMIEACFNPDFVQEVRNYMLYRREDTSGAVVSDLYDDQLRNLNDVKVLLVAQNFNVGGVQKYSTHVLQAVSNCDVTLAVQTLIPSEKLAQLRKICSRLKVILVDEYDFSNDRFDVAFLNSYPTEAADITKLSEMLHANGARVYPIVHTDIHLFTREISDKIDLYSGLITVADVIPAKLSSNTGKDVMHKSHLITPVLDGDAAPLDYAPSKSTRTRKIGYFGRIVSIKGIEFLVKSFARFIRETGQQYELHIYGPVAQKYLGVMINQIAEGDGKGVVFLHNEEITPEARVDILRDLDALVYTTAMDGLPYTFLEAMELGVPVLSTAVGGISHLIRDEYNGMIFDFDGLYVDDLFEKDPYGKLLRIMKERDDVYYTEFARVMERFMTDDALFLKMSRNAISDVHERFSKAVLINKVRALVYAP